jgi:uncharacterized protein (TIGR02996 family)
MNITITEHLRSVIAGHQRTGSWYLGGLVELDRRVFTDSIGPGEELGRDSFGRENVSEWAMGCPYECDLRMLEAEEFLFDQKDGARGLPSLRWVAVKLLAKHNPAFELDNFLRAMQDRPSEYRTSLILADWLEDNADGRGGKLRGRYERWRRREENIGPEQWVPKRPDGSDAPYGLFSPSNRSARKKNNRQFIYDLRKLFPESKIL